MQPVLGLHQWECPQCAKPASALHQAVLDGAEVLAAVTCPCCGVPADPDPPVLVWNLFADAPLTWFTSDPEQPEPLRTVLLNVFGPSAAWCGTIVTAPRELLPEVLDRDILGDLEAREASTDRSVSNDYDLLLDALLDARPSIRLEAALLELLAITTEEELRSLVDSYPELRTAAARSTENRCQLSPANLHPPAVTAARTAILDALGSGDVDRAWHEFDTIMVGFIENSLLPLEALETDIATEADLDKVLAKHRDAALLAARAGLPVAEAHHTTEIASLLLSNYSSNPVVLNEVVERLERAVAINHRCGFPDEVARCRSNLAMALLQRATLDDARGNAERAIALLEAALEHWTEHTAPDDWATTQTNLAYALMHRPGHDDADAARAVEACQAALRVRTPQRNRIEYVYTQVNLGDTATTLAKDDGQGGNEYVRLATESFASAIEQINEETEVPLLAQAHHDAAILYRDLAKERPDAYLDKAAHHAQESLDHRPRDLDAKQWAFSCRLVGEVEQIGKGDEAALPWLEQALEVLTPTLAPYDCVPLASNIGSIYSALGKWEASADAYRIAVIAAQRLPLREPRPDAVPAPTVWRWACYALVRAGTNTDDPERRAALLREAAETIERGRARELGTAIHAAPDSVTITDIRAAIAPDSLLAYLVAAPTGCCALVISADEITIVEVEQMTSARVITLLLGFDINESQVLESSYLFGIHIDEGRFDEALNRAMSEIGPSLMRPIAATCAGQSRVTLIPCGPLGMLPIHAAPWVGEDGRTHCLLDVTDIAYAPSAAMLRAARHQTSSRNPRLVGIGDPSGSSALPGARAEMAEITDLFPGTTDIRYRQHATKDFLLGALPSATHLHLACHGSARLGFPLEAKLHLADGESLTLAEIRANVSLDVRLVVTAACHSGSFDILHNPDEVLGLPAGLLAAGAGAVVAALWAVDDEATAILMTRFYEQLRDGTEPTTALRTSQLWLRDLTRGGKRTFLKRHPKLRIELRTNRQNPPNWRSLFTRYPYRYPEFWAAFVFFGH